MFKIDPLKIQGIENELSLLFQHFVKSHLSQWREVHRIHKWLKYVGLRRIEMEAFYLLLAAEELLQKRVFICDVKSKILSVVFNILEFCLI